VVSKDKEWDWLEDVQPEKDRETTLTED